MCKWCFWIFLLFLHKLEAREIKTLYQGLDPQSLSQSLAFYELYPETLEGKETLRRANYLLTGSSSTSIAELSSLINPTFISQTPHLSEGQVALIEKLASSLPNRLLKGYWVCSEEEVLQLDVEEIDLGKALLFSQLEEHENSQEQVRNYSAVLDLMALRILSHLDLKDSPEQKIAAINRFVFEEMRFRFPPHSVYLKDIDLYTFLPAVMDSRLGVCLGVTALYLSLAQRLALPLEIITPPGHIYLRYRQGEEIINIETTARGVNTSTETYLGVNIRSLQARNIKEVIGMSYVNQASLYLQKARYEEAVHSYEKASLYLKEDPFAKELLGYSYLFVGRKKEGRNLLKEVKDFLPEEAVVKQTMAEDYLEGKVDPEGIQAIFMSTDETRDSLIAKQKQLQGILEKYPHFRAGLMHLSTLWLQLHRSREALKVLQTYHALDPNDPVVEYYLAILHGERKDYASCWNFLHRAEQITQSRGVSPKALKELRLALSLHCPE